MDTAHDFTARLRTLLERERLALAEFLVALSDFDRRRLYVELGYTSLFYLLHRELGLSKGAAHYRAVAAELIQRVPAVVGPLRDGRLCITTIVALSKVLTPENAQDVLPRFFQLSKTQARDVVAELRPEAAAPSRDVVTATHSKDAALGLSFSAPDLGHALVHPANQTPARAPEVAVPAAVPPRPSVDPVTADASRLHVTVSRRFLRKLDAARAALSHSHPGAGMEEILEAGLDLLLERHARQKGLVKRPRVEPRPSAEPDHVPAHVRRAVWTRDGGKCQFPLASGGICGSAQRVQIDHRVARARGGAPTVENLRCLCRAHNLLAAREVYGDEVMDRYCRNPRTPATAAAAPEPAPRSG